MLINFMLLCHCYNRNYSNNKPIRLNCYFYFILKKTSAYYFFRQKIFHACLRNTFSKYFSTFIMKNIPHIWKKKSWLQWSVQTIMSPFYSKIVLSVIIGLLILNSEWHYMINILFLQFFLKNNQLWQTSLQYIDLLKFIVLYCWTWLIQ